MGKHSNGLTIIASGTYLRGEIFSEDLTIVEGGVEGTLTGARVIIKPGGWISGSLRCSTLSIEAGGVINGTVTVNPKFGDPVGQAMLAQKEEEPSLPPSPAQPEQLDLVPEEE